MHADEGCLCFVGSVEELVPEIQIDLRSCHVGSRHLHENVLSGTLPTWGVLGAFPQLETLFLDSNRFVGTLPDWKRNGNFPKLTWL